jgi:hypothetical protein
MKNLLIFANGCLQIENPRPEQLACLLPEQLYAYRHNLPKEVAPRKNSRMEIAGQGAQSNTLGLTKPLPCGAVSIRPVS